MVELTYKEFKDKFLIKDYKNSKGEPTHTRYYKKYFYAFRNQLIKDFGKRNNQKYNLSLESDVVKWFRDYSKNVKKGIDTRPMFK